MKVIEHEDGRRRRRSYDEAFKRDAERMVAEEKSKIKLAAAASATATPTRTLTED